MATIDGVNALPKESHSGSAVPVEIADFDAKYRTANWKV
jgi:hypothetical protein